MFINENWIFQQYSKIQDYVVSNHLYKNQPNNLSHADIMINELERIKHIIICTCPTQPEEIAMNKIKQSNASATHEWTCPEHGKRGIKITVT